MAKQKTTISKPATSAKPKAPRVKAAKAPAPAKKAPAPGKKAAKAPGKKAPAKPAAKPTKKTAKKAATARPPSKRPVKKQASTKKAAGKAPAKKTRNAAKPTPAKAAPAAGTSKKTPKKTAGKPPAKAPPSKAAPSTGKAPAKTIEAPPPPVAAPPPPPAAGAAASGGKDTERKGPARPKRPKPPVAVMPEGIGGLLTPGEPAPKPLIASTDRRAAQDEPAAEIYPTKSPYNKRELDKFRQILLEKRAQVLDEVAGLEGGALTGGGSGNLSHTPQHMADAGTDAAEQTLSLDLAAAERNLVREIDAALQRIEDGVFGLCVATGKPIRKERLAELPWAQYSIDAARRMEGRR